MYEYWEKGLPQNGYVGRYCLCVVDGQTIGGMQANPESYALPRKAGQLLVLVLP